HTLWGVCTTTSCQYHTAWLSYAVLIWNVAGLDIGVAINRPNMDRFQAQLNMTANVVCDSATGGDVCGNIDYHTWAADSTTMPSVPTSFAKGKVSHFAMTYTVGTVDELADLGFVIE